MHNQYLLLRRYFTCAAFVVLWIAMGFYLRLPPIVFPLLGIPLVAAFQLLIAHRPVAQLWARDASRFVLDGRTLTIAVALLVACTGFLAFGRGHLPHKHWQWVAAPLSVAAIPAAFALREQRLTNLSRAWLAIVIAIVIRVAWRVAWAPTWNGSVSFPPEKIPDFLADLVYEFVGLCLVDEVVFRGALDPYLESAGSGRLHEWSSAIFISLLWSAWHFPVYHLPAKTLWQLFANCGPGDFGPIIWGTALSFCARRSRTLAPSAAIHAAGNAYVLTLMR